MLGYSGSCLSIRRIGSEAPPGLKHWPKLEYLFRLIPSSPTPTKQRWQFSDVADGRWLRLPVQGALDLDRLHPGVLLAGVILHGLLGRCDGVNHPRVRKRGAGRVGVVKGTGKSGYAGNRQDAHMRGRTQKRWDRQEVYGHLMSRPTKAARLVDLRFRCSLRSCRRLRPFSLPPLYHQGGSHPCSDRDALSTS